MLAWEDMIVIVIVIVIVILIAMFILRVFDVHEEGLFRVGVKG